MMFENDAGGWCDKDAFGLGFRFFGNRLKNGPVEFEGKGMFPNTTLWAFEPNASVQYAEPALRYFTMEILGVCADGEAGCSSKRLHNGNGFQESTRVGARGAERGRIARPRNQLDSAVWRSSGGILN